MTMIKNFSLILNEYAAEVPSLDTSLPHCARKRKKTRLGSVIKIVDNLQDKIMDFRVQIVSVIMLPINRKKQTLNN